MKKYISLAVKCPHCGESLMDLNHLIHGYPSVKVNIETKRARGIIWLCSIYDCFDHENNIELREDEEVQFYCPHCNQSLMLETRCNLCNAQMVGFNIKVGGKVDICSRKGCKNHYVVFENLADEINKFYQEYGTGE
ncbi:MAG TPA: hypothetical protein PLI65_11700 [Bacteroidales bacterium]|nr:hypothetical protein [Bacteroidales bacterium]HRX11147.1 hypothetical protein [Draconibacterium sp.]